MRPKNGAMIPSSSESLVFEPEGDFRGTPPWTIIVPPVLLVLTMGATLAIGLPLPVGSWPLLWTAVTVLLMLRAGMEWCRPRRLRVAQLLFVLHGVVVLATAFVTPFIAIYAWFGYMDVMRIFSGRIIYPALLLTAAGCGLGQGGGLAGVQDWPPLIMILIGVNMLIGTGAIIAERRRERTLADREEALQRLGTEQERSAQLRDELVAHARRTGTLDERQRLSREIHDTVAQSLLGVITQLEGIDAGQLSAADLTRLERAQRSAREGLAEARRAVAALASPRLDHDDLTVALDQLVRAWNRDHAAAAEFDVEGHPRRTPHEATLLRVCQEALSNVARHAYASRVRVGLTYEHDRVTLEVGDDGRGFHHEADSDGHGLPGMRQRLDAIGGTLMVDSSPGEGCVVRVEVQG
ncbi:hypothetical protein CGZ91_00275 [Parenemella sanctibonifatiensis]|uniref:Histidine kinase domain-containing protein n=2 Tax=Parenemella sanctibonifatiensis TaxID=2016505 RepID=A0A255EKE9_9ACTN|nr:hypothetical protein CGZ91_00275 [Parenemella sanctibonifatiensis]